MSLEHSPTRAGGPSNDDTVSGVLDDYLTPEQLADELRISTRTLYRWRRVWGDAPPVTKVGRRLLYRRGAVDRWPRSLEDGDTT